ncbi:hypothetical protein ATANTOWER_006162 [Ataeniobius toweri]|uniref:Uncharacterized protein n=1 Tax=Ataeniobius toweri TaxID=208326 RepID=A0ABU7C4D6_9TELE|nr:hypothetical protein [Ataeniobius toweri]
MAAVSGGNTLGLVALAAGPGGAALPVVSAANTTAATSSPAPGTDTRGCENGALMDSFGIFLQGLLAVMAFSTLMCEYDPKGCCVSDIRHRLLMEAVFIQ